MAETIYGVGPKRAAQAMGYSVGYCYAMARDPADPEHPDNTGVELAPWDRHVALLEAASTRPHLRPLVRLWVLEMSALGDRLLDYRDAPDTSDDAVFALTGDYSRDYGETVEALVKRRDDRAALEEVAQDLEHLSKLARVLRQRIEDRSVTPIPRRAS